MPTLPLSALLLASALAATSGAAPTSEAVSLLGEPLPPPELSQEFRARQEGLLADARARLAEHPRDVQAAIWVGRRTAYLGRYREAIEIYSRALEAHPDDPRLLRHRGHRWITVRELTRAVADLTRAGELVRGEPDVVEPDGLPNARGIPTSTLQSNIWYHLGLAHYLRGELESALAAYRECAKVSGNPDMRVATSYWLYLTLRRLGQEAEAAELLAGISPALELIENHDYHRLLLVYRGLESAEELGREAAADPGAVRSPTLGYGLAVRHLLDGRREEARRAFREVLRSPAWAAFGYLAAEAELARLAAP